jgi:CubicO group peptidase (beta-lactamase class C family)
MDAPIPSDTEIRKILVERIDAQHQGVGIVVGVIEPAGRRIVSYGSLDKGDTRVLDGNTIFEIGSVTKVFTSLLLADMVQHGEAALTDPVARYLPGGVKIPERGGRSITLEDLATHTSGLPRMPTNFFPRDSSNPYADYSVEQLYAFLSAYSLPRDIGIRYEYSNLGGGLLGHVLARASGSDYETVVRARILDPLGMKNTSITLTPAMKQRLAVGHNAQLQPVANWDLPTLAGAGALRSNVNDLLTFLSAELGYTKSNLAPAMAAMLAQRRPASPGLEVGLAWHVSTRKPNRNEIVWHNGGTGGYRSFVGFDLQRRVGVVLLSNTSTDAGVDDIGFHLFDTSLPLAKPPVAHTEVKIDPKVFDSYVGRYQFPTGGILTISREYGQFFAQLTGQPRFEIFAESEQDFFLKVVDAQLTFEVDGTGRGIAVTLHQGGRDQKATRLP